MPECIRENVPLAPLTTMGIGGRAQYFCEIKTLAELETVVAWAKKHNHPITVLGGGSNVLVDDAGVQGIVIRVCFLDIEYKEHEDGEIAVTVGAGVIFNELIETLVAKDIWGLENLSGIPGSVGAVPIQNVGAYGVEACDVVSSVEAYDVERACVTKFNKEECRFAYRHSLFKTEEGKKYIVLSVTFALCKTASPKLSYKDLAHFFETNAHPTLAEIRNAVCAIRKGKFPDWHVLGTAGSFFKNPIIDMEAYEVLREKYPEIPAYIGDDSSVKISLGWVLDHVLGYKGRRVGNVGLYEKQALVLVQYGGATAREILSFADSVRDAVERETGIVVEYEVMQVS